MQMPTFLMKRRRQRWCNLVVHNGEMLRECYQQLHSLSAYEGGWDAERERLHQEIERRERRLESLRTKLKETAPHV